MEIKQCITCKQERHLSEFARHAKRPDGLAAVCKQCKSEYDRGRYLAKSDAYKRKAAEWRSANPERHKEIQERSRKSNQAAINAKSRENRAADPARHAEYSRSYRQRNPGASTEYGRRWRAANPDAARALVRLKQAQRARAMPPWADVAAIKAVYEDAKRLEQADGIKRHVDHVVPINGRDVCGLHVACNLQVLTEAENLKKSNKYAAELA